MRKSCSTLSREQLQLFECSPNFLRASSMNAQLKYEPSVLTFSTRWKNFFFSRDLFADVMSVHNRNMKHARAIEFD